MKSLPPELVVEVSRYLDPSSLANLRRTCRGYNDVLDHVFAERVISQRNHSMARESLTSLLELSQSRFRRDIKCLRLAPGSNHARSELSGDSLVILLRKAFTNLQVLDEVVIEGSDYTDRELPDHFGNVLQAMAQAGLRSKALRTSLQNSSGFTAAFHQPYLRDSERRRRTVINADEDADVLKHVETLHLHVCGSEMLHSLDTVPGRVLFGEFTMPAMFLRQAAALKRLELIGDKDWLHNGLLASIVGPLELYEERAPMPGPNPLSHLRDLRLDSVTLLPSTLLKFISKASSTLQKLVLSCVTLIPGKYLEEGDPNFDPVNLDSNDGLLWKKFFRDLPEFGLHVFCFNQLREFDGEGFFQHGVSSEWHRDTGLSWEHFLEQFLEQSAQEVVEATTDVTYEYKVWFAEGSETSDEEGDD